MSIVYNDTIQYPNLNPPKPCSFNINLFCSNTGHLAQGTLSFWSKAIILDSSEAGYHTFTLRAVPAQKKNGTVDLEHVALEGHTLCVYIFIYIYELRTKLLVWGICHQQIWWSPIGFQGFARSGHHHQSRSMQFTLWDDSMCYMIEKLQESEPRRREFLCPFDNKGKWHRWL